MTATVTESATAAAAVAETTNPYNAQVTKGNASRVDSRWSIRIATIRDIPITIHASFLLLMGFLGWRTFLAAGMRAALIEQALVVLVFVCVALHELGHATAAVRCGVPINGITLYPFGGVARMARRPPHGMVEVFIASAGPVVNLVIAALLFLASGGTVAFQEGSIWMRLVGLLFWANLILAGFNLLPAFPLDGGRILRGLMTTRMGWVRATVWAASIGQVAAVLLILVGVVQDFWLVLAGLLVLPAANAELRYALAVRQFADRRVGDLVRTEIITLGPATTVSEAADRSVTSPLADFLIVENERPVAFLSAPKLWNVVRSDEPGTRAVAFIAEPLADPILEDAPVEDAIERFDQQGSAVAPVVDGEGALLGVVAVGDLIRAAQLSRRANGR